MHGEVELPVAREAPSLLLTPSSCFSRLARKENEKQKCTERMEKDNNGLASDAAGIEMVHLNSKLSGRNFRLLDCRTNSTELSTALPI